MSGFVRSSISAAFLLTAAWPALADEVPVLDIEPVCHGIARQAADPSERGGPDLSFAQCMKSERLVQKRLVKEWPTFISAEKQNCVAEAQMAGQASYTDLLTCLEMARDVRKLNSTAPSYQIEQ